MTPMERFTEQARQLVVEWINSAVSPGGITTSEYNVLIERIASFAAEAATQGQAVSGALREALRDAAIEAHVGFNHPRQWEDCDLAVCDERRRLIGDYDE